MIPWKNYFINARFFANIAVMFALCLVQEETVKMGFCHESVQAASLVVEEQEDVGGTSADEWQQQWCVEDSDRDSEL